MTETVTTAAAARLEQLRSKGAHRYDPARFRYLEALCQRLEAKSALPASHSERFRQALDAFDARFEAADARAQQLLDDAQARYGDATLEELEALRTKGDYKQLTRAVQRLQRRQIPSPLADLHLALRDRSTNTLSTSTPAAGDAVTAAVTGSHLHPRRELKALAPLRAMQAQQAITQLIEDAIARTPVDAGPMNPHRLVTRAIKQLRTLSPEYLEHFVRYVDTLVWLERLGKKG